MRARLRPDVESASLAVSAEFALAPLAQKAAEGQETQPIGERDDLLAHVDSASGEKFQHTTSVHRAFALAQQTHPLVDTAHASVRSSVGRVFQERVLDERGGRAIAGEQGEFALSVSGPPCVFRGVRGGGCSQKHSRVDGCVVAVSRGARLDRRGREGRAAGDLGPGGARGSPSVPVKKGEGGFGQRRCRRCLWRECEWAFDGRSLLC